ncbi:4Fe-4S ferredoxin [Fervidicella metallireducens AeB]|uniref:4Fe-4S ferredoxin n=1 Tax=Fervidicella metallireducens AeB TaxID=1403537 RepID=A0A017RW97_9CLOT|nr:4Fe-4S binding protein [Fervidicella metallireducens]EYE88881.1 4Fe-4S ferredoxin [Fervidicella metallireducens AeB]
MKNNRLIKSVRYILLSIFLIFVTVEAYLHQVLGGRKSPSIHALCPYGELESMYSLVFNGTFIQKIFSGTFILLMLTLILAIVFRRSFCGLICPFGALQEFFGVLGKKLFKKRFVMNKNIDKPLRYLKYIILVVTLYYAWITAGLWVNPYDPWAAYGHISSGFSSLKEEYPIGFMILILILIGSLLYDRFFCKYLCPIGALYGIISKFSLTKITRDKDRCINCNLCSKNCPVNINVSELSEINSSECINCNLCMIACPSDKVLDIKTAGKSVKPLTNIILVISIFLGGIMITKATGLYEVTPPKITASTRITADEIKGYMTLEEISVAFKIELNELYERLQIPASIPKDTPLKEIKNFIPGFEVETVRELLR